MVGVRSPLTQGAPRRSPRVVIAASALAACAGVLLLAAVWNASSSAGPQEKLVVVDLPETYASGLGQMELTPQQALQLQRLWLYGTDETDMWIRVAEAIDAETVNDPALPPVPDSIATEAEQASNEAKLEREYMEKYYGGTPNDSTAWRVVPVAGNGQVLLVEA